MAQFRGTVRGQRGLASRLGSKKSGLIATANGWETGARISITHDADGRDRVRVYRNGGSNGGGETLLAEWVNGDPGFVYLAERG